MGPLRDRIWTNKSPADIVGAVDVVPEKVSESLIKRWLSTFLPDDPDVESFVRQGIGAFAPTNADTNGNMTTNTIGAIAAFSVVVKLASGTTFAFNNGAGKLILQTDGTMIADSNVKTTAPWEVQVDKLATVYVEAMRT